MKKCLIIENEFKKESRELASAVRQFLQERNIESSVFSYDGGSVPKEDMELELNGVDFVITLGGDGTVLFASRKCAPLGIPVFSINLGVFGFLAQIPYAEWQKELDSFLSGKASVEKRSLLSVEVLRSSKTVFSGLCLNDAVVSNNVSLGLLDMDVAYNRSLLGTFKSTGIIVSTPTGSTAYSAAAGGPIADPSLDVMILTPISSFSLSARPLVFASKGEIAVTLLPSRSSASISLDGQINFELEMGDVVIIGMAEHKALLACSSGEKFYAALRSKLNWSGGIRA